MKREGIVAQAGTLSLQSNSIGNSYLEIEAGIV